MKLLLDTCTFLWLVSDPKLLSAMACRAINNNDNDLWLSDSSVWEICLKWEARKLRLPSPPRRWVLEQSQIWQLGSLGIESSQLFRAGELPMHHRDPFDRLLVATAIDSDLTLVTPDPAIAAYPVAVLW